ncbi:MAG: hypothetical protein IKX88_08875 [Thermoguttaceae bacterium]|nr:hypothetical protein [Thermoguttaceae bacterium]
MKSLLKGVLTTVLTLVGGILCENSVYSQSKEPTIVEVADVDNPAQLKHTLEIYPTEIYFGDVVYFASYTENTSDKTFLFFPEKREDIEKNFVSALKISDPQSNREYSWRPKVGYEEKLRESGVQITRVFSASPLYPDEKRLMSSLTIEFPPLDDWDVPFWKELRENMSPEGIVCKLQITGYYYVQSGDVESQNRSEESSEEHNVKTSLLVDHEFRKLQQKTFTQDILIKPRPKVELFALEKQRSRALEKPSEFDIRANATFGVLSETDDGYILLNKKEYAPHLFIREGLRIPIIPYNPTSLEGWQELDASFNDGTLSDEISFSRLLLEYYSADEGEKTERAKKDLIEWLSVKPAIQRNFFLNKIVKSGVSFLYQTPLADKSRALLRTVYDSLDDKDKLDVCNFEKAIYHSTSLVPPKGKILRKLPSEFEEPTEKEIAAGSKSLKDGYRMWVCYDTIFKRRIAATFVKYDVKTDIVSLKIRGGTELVRFSSFCKEDQDYILELCNSEETPNPTPKE